MSVPNRFAHSDNVGYKLFPLQLESPEMGAYPSKANLNLISNEDASSLSHMSVERIVLYTHTNTELCLCTFEHTHGIQYILYKL